MASLIRKPFFQLLFRANPLWQMNQTPFHLSATNYRRKDRGSLVRNLPSEDEGVTGEHSVTVGTNFGPMYPTLETNQALYNGIVFTELPIIYLKCSQNNTIISLVDPKNPVDPLRVILLSSCGIEGFRNCKKGTNVAGQAVGLSVGRKSLDMGYSTVRIVVRGLGPGRAAGIKGLEMAGLNIVSLTDDTPIPNNGNRPRKVRRL